MWRKITLITSISLIVCLITAIITMSVIKVDLKPRFSENAQNGVLLYAENHRTSAFDIRYESDDYFNIITTINKSFKTSYLNALTNGLASEPYSITRSGTSTTITTLRNEAKYALYLDYQTSNFIYKPDGSRLKDNYDKDITYYGITILVNDNNDKFDEIVFYFHAENTPNSSSIRLVANGNFKNLMNVLQAILDRP